VCHCACASCVAIPASPVFRAGWECERTLLASLALFAIVTITRYRRGLCHDIAIKKKSTIRALQYSSANWNSQSTWLSLTKTETCNLHISAIFQCKLKLIIYMTAVFTDHTHFVFHMNVFLDSLPISGLTWIRLLSLGLGQVVTDVVWKFYTSSAYF